MQCRTAIGAAMEGMRPIVRRSSPILQLANDLNNAARIIGDQHPCPIRCVLRQVEPKGAAIHSQSREGVYSHYPGWSW